MVDETLRQWGENIRLRRQYLNAESVLRTRDEPCMTQEQLAKLLEPAVTQSTVARWEAGTQEPRRHYKRELARVLQTDVRMLFPMVRAEASA